MSEEVQAAPSLDHPAEEHHQGDRGRRRRRRRRRRSLRLLDPSQRFRLLLLAVVFVLIVVFVVGGNMEPVRLGVIDWFRMAVLPHWELILLILAALILIYLMLPGRETTNGLDRIFGPPRRNRRR